MAVTQADLEKAKEAIHFLSSLSEQSVACPNQSREPSVSESQPSTSSGRGFISTRCQAVLDNLAKVRSNFGQNNQTRSKRYSEVGKLFKSSKKLKMTTRKITPWTHRFVCLSDCSQHYIPTTASQKDTLMSAGLGEKKIVFEDVDCSAEIFKDTLLQNYPKLKEGGGYHLCKCKSNSRELESLSSAVLVSPRALQQCGGNSRTYIRPLQRDLDLSRENESTEKIITEVCLSCGKDIPIDDLELHVVVCRVEDRKSPSSELIDISDDDDLPKYPAFSVDIDDARSPFHSKNQENFTPSNGYGSSSDLMIPTLSNDVQYNKYSSPTPPPYSPVAQYPAVNISLSAIIKMIQKKFNIDMSPECESKLILEIRRTDVIEDALMHASKKKFCPTKTLKIIFVSESGEDTGGLRREFFRLLCHGITENYFIGTDYIKTFQQNVPALQRNIFKYLGIWTAMSITQDGPGLPVLMPALYEYMISRDLTSDSTIKNDEIPDLYVKGLIELIISASDNKQLQAIFSDELYSSLLIETGYCKSLLHITTADAEHVVDILKRYHCLIKVKAQIDQFIDGLHCLEIDAMIQQYPDKLKPLFVDDISKRTITPDYIKSLVVAHFSPKENQEKRKKEEAMYMYFVNFLDECEEGTTDVSMGEILSFFTGSDREPPLGFPYIPTLLFDEKNTLATSSTCSLTLTLPVHKDYNTFKEKLILSFKGHDGFGVI